MIEYVNIHGRPVNVAADTAGSRPSRKTAGLKKVKDRTKATHSAGFKVVGWSPLQWSALQSKHAALVADYGRTGKGKNPGAFEDYARRARPPRISGRLYELADAAEACAELARRGGHHLVQVQEQLKAEACPPGGHHLVQVQEQLKAEA